MRRTRTRRFGVVLVAWLAVGWAGVGAAERVPAQRYPVLTPAEARFRELRELAARDPAEAVRGLEALLAEGFEPADAVHAALAWLLPPGRAEAHWRAVVEASPPSPFLPEALEALARLAEERLQWDRAADLYRRLAEASPDEDWLVRALASRLRVLERMNRPEEALRVAERLWVEFAHRPEARLAEPVLARGSGDPFRPVSGERIFERGRVLLEKGRREEAVRTLRELRRRLVPGSRIGPRVDLALGKALYFLRRYEEALAPLGRAARTGSPRTAEEARFYRARCLFGLDRGDEGARDLVALARERPRSPRAPLYLYQAYRVFEGRRMGAEADAARSLLLERYGTSDEARDTRFNQGWARFRQGAFREAAEAFARSAQGARPGWIRARGLYWQARALAAAGDRERALAVARRLVSEHPLGYYARLARRLIAARGVGRLDLPDPRAGAGNPDLPFPVPTPEDLRPRGEDPRITAYLRLGLPEAARRLLAREAGPGPRWARLLYWAGDFKGALRAAGRSWWDWPAGGAIGPLEPPGLAYPFALPAQVEAASRDAGVHPHLVLAVAHTESHFDPRAYSPWEARGLMQFIPSTGARVARRAGLERFEPEDLFDPALALRLGALHLRELLDRFDGNVVAAVAAYNAGARAVERWVRTRGSEPDDVFVESVPYRETRRYIKKVLTALDAYARIDPPGLWGQRP